tara:strand:+ start:1966 stop:3192 length:1227 start_codon:yes stop_codon:yes gene_type:complete
MFAIRKKGESQNLYICSSVGNIKTVQRDHEINISGHQFKVLAGQSVHRSTGTANEGIAKQIAKALTQIVLDENPHLKKERKVASVVLPAKRVLGDPNNVDNWTVEDAFEYRRQNEELSKEALYFIKRFLAKAEFATGHYNYPKRFADWPLVDGRDIEIFNSFRWVEIEAKRNKPMAGGYKNNELSYIRSAMKVAEKVSYHHSDGKYRCPTIKQFPENDNTDNFLTPEEAKAVLEWMAKNKRNHLNMFLAQAYTGARPIELARLTWDCVHLEEGKSRVQFYNYKGGNGKKTRWVPLHPIVADMLKTIPRSVRNDFVFLTFQGRPFTVESDSGTKSPSWINSFTECRKALGIQRTSYAFRHSFATWLLENGETIVTIMKLMGHSQMTTTQKYLGVADATKINAVNNLPAL